MCKQQAVSKIWDTMQGMLCQAEEDLDNNLTVVGTVASMKKKPT